MDETRLHGSLAINENQFFHQVSLLQNVDMRAQMIRLSELRSEVCVEDNMRTCVQLREVHVPSNRTRLTLAAEYVCITTATVPPCQPPCFMFSSC